MPMQSFTRALRKRPVIAAARDLEGVKSAAASQSAAIFVLGGSIITLPEMARVAKSSGKRVFVHMDLLEGLGHDAAAVEWIAQTTHPDGLISTRAPLLRHAHKCGLITIQRLFVMDSSSLNHGIRQLRQSRPDMLEVLPGLVPKAISALVMALPGSEVIAGGMVTEESDVRAAIRAGAIGVSSSISSLWTLTREEIDP